MTLVTITTRMVQALTLVVLLGTSAVWGQSSESDSAGEKAAAKMLDEGMTLLQAGKANESIPRFDKVIAYYEKQNHAANTKYFSARTQPETLAYLLEVAAGNKSGSKKGMSGVVVSYDWAFAYYLKAYAFTELGELPKARTYLEKALELAPHNAQFLSELGDSYQREGKWNKSIELFTQAEDAANGFSPDDVKQDELSRAWRGMAYSYVELNKLDEAEKLYKKCLKMNSNDTVAKKELQYVKGLQHK